jgi:ABC-2 type transport system permease protein
MMHLLRKELRELCNKQMILSLLGTMLLIILMGVVMTTTMSESLESSGELHIIDYDDTEFTRSVITALEADGYDVEVSPVVKSNYELLEENEWKEAVLIPLGFTEKVLEQKVAGEVSSLSMLTSTTSMDIMMSGSTSTDAFTAKVKELLMTKYLGEDMDFLAKPVTETPWTYANHAEAQVDSYTLVNSLSLFDRLMPLILFMLIVLTAQTIITAVAAEKNDKTLETLLASPVPRSHVIGAKMLAALIVAIIYALSYGAGFLVTMLMTVDAGGAGIDLGEAMTELATINQAVMTLELQIPAWGWVLVIVQLILTIGIALMAAIILGALVQDAKSSQNASLPILVCAMLPYILSMISDIRQMEGITKILMYAIPFTHTFIATSCLRFHDYGLLCGGLVYQAVFFTLMTVAALKLYQSDILFIGMPKRAKKETSK